MRVAFALDDLADVHETGSSAESSSAESFLKSRRNTTRAARGLPSQCILKRRCIGVCPKIQVGGFVPRRELTVEAMIEFGPCWRLVQKSDSADIPSWLVLAKTTKPFAARLTARQCSPRAYGRSLRSLLTSESLRSRRLVSLTATCQRASWYQMTGVGPSGAVTASSTQPPVVSADSRCC